MVLIREGNLLPLKWKCGYLMEMIGRNDDVIHTKGRKNYRNGM